MAAIASGLLLSAGKGQTTEQPRKSVEVLETVQKGGNQVDSEM